MPAKERTVSRSGRAIRLRNYKKANEEGFTADTENEERQLKSKDSEKETPIEMAGGKEGETKNEQKQEEQHEDKQEEEKQDKAEGVEETEKQKREKELKQKQTQQDFEKVAEETAKTLKDIQKKAEQAKQQLMMKQKISEELHKLEELQRENLRLERDITEKRKVVEQQNHTGDCREEPGSHMTNGGRKDGGKQEQQKRSQKQEGGALSIDQLRKCEELDRLAEERLRNLGLNIETSSSRPASSQENTGRQGRGVWSASDQESCKCGHSQADSRKSGLETKSTEAIVCKQVCPQQSLSPMFVTDIPKFFDLNLRLFVAGELETIRKRCVSESEREGRLNLLQKLLYYAGKYQWRAYLDLYAGVISQIEAGHAGWDSEFGSLEMMTLMAHPLTSNRSQVFRGGESNRRREGGNYSWGGRSDEGGESRRREGGYNSSGGRSEESDRVWFCRPYQRGDCNQSDPHWGYYNGRRVTVHHICAVCYFSDRVSRKHPENAPECPHSGKGKD